MCLNAKATNKYLVKGMTLMANKTALSKRLPLISMAISNTPNVQTLLP